MQHPVACNTDLCHTSQSLNHHKMVNEEDMRQALAEIETSEDPNYTAIAKKHKLTPLTLIRRAQGKTTSREEFQSQIH
jgi:hypothetical protein